MASPRITAVVMVLAIVLSACADGGNASPDEDGPVVTRALLPPAVASPPTTTTTTLPPLQADRLAQTQVRSVLKAAQELYAERGTYDASLDEVGALVPAVPLVLLQEAALHDGVVYDAHDQRLTLHRQSTSGTWFCIDATDQGTDYGNGDTFQIALAACTDGVPVDGWGDIFSPIGPDEASIKAIFGLLVDALTSGDPVTASVSFAAETGCTVDQLTLLWPAGLTLIASDDFELQSLTITGDKAVAEVSLGPLSTTDWDLARKGTMWRHAADPCELLQPLASERRDEAGSLLLDEGLFAVKSVFVMRTDFDFGPDALADLDPDFELVAADDVSFGTLSYTGSSEEGLLLTAAAPGRFLCAVESNFAPTAFGEGGAIADIDTPDECRASG